MRKRAAAKRLPEIDRLMNESFSKLNALEKDRCDSIDRVADCFASLMRDITRELIETDNDIDDFTYNLGRMVYLLDAVDDVEKDSKKKRYNPLLLNYGECASKQEYLPQIWMNCRFYLIRLTIKWSVATTVWISSYTRAY